MAKKPGSNNKGEWAFFDVVYEDGSQRSNRRVPAELLEVLCAGNQPVDDGQRSGRILPGE